MDVKMGCKHCTNPGNHRPQEFPFSVKSTFNPLVNSDKNIFTELMECTVYEIGIQNGPADSLRPQTPDPLGPQTGHFPVKNQKLYKVSIDGS